METNLAVKDESVSKGLFFEAYNKAKIKKETKNSDLSALLNFKVQILSQEEKKKREEKANQKKRDAQALADKIKSAEERLKEIEESENWEILPESVAEYEELSIYIDSARRYGDKQFQGSVQVAKIIKDIQATNPEAEADILKWIEYIATVGRGDIINVDKVEKIYEGKLPEGTIRFKNLCLLHKRSKIYPEKIASPADQSIFKAIYELIGRYYRNKKVEKRIAIEKMKKIGNPNLSALKGNKTGIYRIYFPEKGKKGQPGYQTEGIGIVELINVDKGFLIVKSVDGAGSLKWMANNKGDWIPFAAVFTGRVLENKTPSNKLEFAKKFAKTLHYAVFNSNGGCD